MTLIVPEKLAEDMRHWIDIVEKFNKATLGQGSDYEVIGIGATSDGTLTLQLRKKKG